MELLNHILQLPERCLVNKKISKAFFKRNFELTSSEKALLDDPQALISIDWMASISFTSANIPLYKDEKELFEEVQIIVVDTAGNHSEKKQYRIADLIQKYIPYPVLLCIRLDKWLMMNVCDKTINQNDSSRRVVDKKYDTSLIQYQEATPLARQFLESMAFTGLDKTNLKSYYVSYIQRIMAFQIAEVMGRYSLKSVERTQNDREILEKIETLQKEILVLQNQVKVESQSALLVALNIQIHEKRTQIKQLKASIIA